LPDALKAAVDLFTPNAHETAGLEQMQNVIVTLGADGCLIRSTGETIPALRLPLVVDTTGAGDTFNGVLAAGLAAGSKLSAAAADAIRASGVSVTRKYAASAIPSAAEVSEYLKNLN
jgi:ribokinase